MKKLLMLIVLLVGCVFAFAAGVKAVSPAAYYKFNEASGNAVDSSGNAPTLININASYVAGKINNAARGNASLATSIFNTTISSNFTFMTGNFTIAFWYNSTDAGSGGTNIMSRGRGTGEHGWGISYNQSEHIVFEYNGTTINGTTKQFNTEGYHYVAFVREGIGANQFKVYVDGNNTNNFTFIQNISNSSGRFSLDGGGGGGTPTFIDNLRIYNSYAFTQANINADYNNGNGFEGDPTAPFVVTLNQPPNNSTIANLMFNATVTYDSTINNLTNATLFVYNSSNFLVNMTTNNLSMNPTNTSTWNITSLPIQTGYIWNVLACQQNQTGNECAFAFQNFTFNYGFLQNSQTWENTTGELSTTNFKINITLANTILNSQATLFYNNTQYGSSTTTEGSNRIFSSNVITPDVNTATAKSFFWILQFTDTSGNVLNFNTTALSQIVNPISIDNCTTNTDLVLNYTLFDEDNLTMLTVGGVINSTINVQVTLSPLSDSSIQNIFNRSYINVNPARVCIAAGLLNTTSYRLDATASYESTNRVKEYHNIQNFTLNNNTSPLNRGLYDLLTTRSTEFLITAKDENFLPVKNGIIEISRKYLELGTNIVIEIPKTDNDGKTVAHFVTGDEVYTLVVKKDGRIISTFENQIPVCQNAAIGQCTFTLNALMTSTNPADFSSFGDLNYVMQFNNSARTINVNFNTASGGTKQVNLQVIHFTSLGNTTICNSTQTGSSGNLLCSIPQTYGNTTVQAMLFSNSALVTTAYYSLSQTGQELFGGTGVFLILILVIILPLMFLSSGFGIVIAGIFGLIIAAILNIYTGGSLIGIGSTILWLIIAGGIVIWKISKRE